jgi:hypothetical protein
MVAFRFILFYIASLFSRHAKSPLLFSRRVSPGSIVLSSCLVIPYSTIVPLAALPLHAPSILLLAHGRLKPIN